MLKQVCLTVCFFFVLMGAFQNKAHAGFKECVRWLGRKSGLFRPPVVSSNSNNSSSAPVPSTPLALLPTGLYRLQFSQPGFPESFVVTKKNNGDGTVTLEITERLQRDPLKMTVTIEWDSIRVNNYPNRFRQIEEGDFTSIFEARFYDGKSFTFQWMTMGLPGLIVRGEKVRYVPASSLAQPKPVQPIPVAVKAPPRFVPQEGIFSKKRTSTKTPAPARVQLSLRQLAQNHTQVILSGRMAEEDLRHLVFVLPPDSKSSTTLGFHLEFESENKFVLWKTFRTNNGSWARARDDAGAHFTSP